MSAPFTAAMVQMCTSLSPEASFRQAEGFIREAAGRGAVYVQTPEVSNLIQKNRKRGLPLQHDVIAAFQRNEACSRNARGVR